MADIAQRGPEGEYVQYAKYIFRFGVSKFDVTTLHVVPLIIRNEQVDENDNPQIHKTSAIHAVSCCRVSAARMHLSALSSEKV